MTVIAVLTNGTSRALLGDVLVTTTRPMRRPPLSLPLWGQLKRRQFGRTFLYETVQKLVQVSPHLCVGWSGNRAIAERLLQDLAERGASTLQDVERAIERRQEAEPLRYDLALAALTSKAGQGQIQSYPTLKNPFYELGTPPRVITAAGSGATDFLDAFERLSIDRGSSMDQVALTIGGYFLGTELLGAGGLGKGYGAAYEVVSPVRDGFLRHPWTLLLATMDINPETDAVSFTPLRFLHVWYSDDTLLCLAARIARPLADTELIAHIIESPISARKTEDWARREFESMPRPQAFGCMTNVAVGGRFLGQLLVPLTWETSPVTIESESDARYRTRVHRDRVPTIRDTILERIDPAALHRASELLDHDRQPGT